MILNIPMKLRNFLMMFRDEGEVIASSFGQARLVKCLHRKYTNCVAVPGKIG